MKLLQLHAEFKLPDNFNGTLSDALRLMTDYYDTPEANNREVINSDHPDFLSSKEIKLGEWESKALQRLIRKNDENGSRLVTCVFLGDWNSDECPN